MDMILYLDDASNCSIHVVRNGHGISFGVETEHSLLARLHVDAQL